MPQEVEMPEIPRYFINNPKIRHVLSHTIEEFDYEEQMAIRYYCFLNLPVSNIAAATELSKSRVLCTLTLYSERLNFKLDIFKQAALHTAKDVLPVSELLALDFWQ